MHKIHVRRLDRDFRDRQHCIRTGKPPLEKIKNQPIFMDTLRLIHDPDDGENEDIDLSDTTIAMGFDHLIDVQIFTINFINLK